MTIAAQVDTNWRRTDEFQVGGATYTIDSYFLAKAGETNYFESVISREDGSLVRCEYIFHDQQPTDKYHTDFLARVKESAEKVSGTLPFWRAENDISKASREAFDYARNN